MIDVFAITAVLMMGTAGLPHVIIRFYTTPKVPQHVTRRSGHLCSSPCLILPPCASMLARYNLITTLHKKPIEQVCQIEWVAKWVQTKLPAIVDKNGDGIITIAKGNAFQMESGRPEFEFPDLSNPNEVFLDNDIIVLSTPEVAGRAGIMSVLVTAGGLAVALSTKSGLLITMSSAVSHDIYYRILNPREPEQLRLLVGRLMILPAVAIIAYLGINPPGFVAQVVAFAFGLAVAGLFPIILMGIFDRRMNKQGQSQG